jgi:hypothetical protein
MPVGNQEIIVSVSSNTMSNERQNSNATSAYFTRRALREHNPARRKRFEEAAESYRSKAAANGTTAAIPDQSPSIVLKPRRQRLIELFRNAPPLVR